VIEVGCITPCATPTRAGGAHWGGARVCGYFPNANLPGLPPPQRAQRQRTLGTPFRPGLISVAPSGLEPPMRKSGACWDPAQCHSRPGNERSPRAPQTTRAPWATNCRSRGYWFAAAEGGRGVALGLANLAASMGTFTLISVSSNVCRPSSHTTVHLKGIFMPETSR